MNTSNDYQKQAEDFLSKYSIRCRITLSNSKPAPWGDEDKGERNHYRVTLWRDGWKRDRRKFWERLADNDTIKHNADAPAKNRLVFDFWGSIADAEKGVDPSVYDVLACISSDAYCPETFADFCAEYGYDSDSIKAFQTFRRCSSFAKRLRVFFTEEELRDLAEIR